jgi:hypothetical protein
VIPVTARLVAGARDAYHRVVRASKALVTAVLALTATPLAVAQFSKKVPESVPSVEGWERIAGDLELDNPRVAIQYEFYVNPERQAIYEVVRYRVTDLSPLGEGGKRPAATEKLQWDLDGRDVRRFECVANAPGRGAGCTWQEMEKGGADYIREVPLLLQLYAAHNWLSKRRAAAGG